jgi:hypothetical protein
MLRARHLTGWNFCELSSTARRATFHAKTSRNRFADFASTSFPTKQLFRELAMYRHPPASETRHPLFRAQAERWLEFLVRQDVTKVDSTLDPNFAYAQVLATTVSEHGILHFLSVTRAGRVAILELKTVEHPVFLLQGAKYWLRVSRHLEQEDFPRYGYFSGVPLQSNPPVVYLVAPALRFHPATEIPEWKLCGSGSRSRGAGACL